MASTRRWPRPGPTSRRSRGNRIFTLTAPYAGTKVHLLAAVARALHCDAVMLSTAGLTERLHVFGFELDIEQADMLYTSLLLQMTRAEARQAYPLWITGRALMAERRSFMIGFIAGVKPRLEAAYATAWPRPTTAAPRARNWCSCAVTWPSRPRCAPSTRTPARPAALTGGAAQARVPRPGSAPTSTTVAAWARAAGR